IIMPILPSAVSTTTASSPGVTQPPSARPSPQNTCVLRYAPSTSPDGPISAAVLYTVPRSGPRWELPRTTCTPSPPAARCTAPVSGPGMPPIRPHSASAGTPGVNPVVAASGSTTNSAPVAATHRSTYATHLSTLDLTDSAVSGPGSGATCTAAAVNARIRHLHPRPTRILPYPVEPRRALNNPPTPILNPFTCPSPPTTPPICPP